VLDKVRTKRRPSGTSYAKLSPNISDGMKIVVKMSESGFDLDSIQTGDNALDSCRFAE
jgi:hypothetical protein